MADPDELDDSWIRPGALCECRGEGKGVVHRVEAVHRQADGRVTALLSRPGGSGPGRLAVGWQHARNLTPAGAAGD